MKQFSLMAMLCLFFSLTVSAQTSTYINKTGKVLSLKKAKSTFKASKDQLTISVAKTGGKAETQVNIYVNNKFKAKIEFDNGNYTRTKTKTLNNVKNKNIKVEIVNQSVGNTFKYRLTCKGKNTSSSTAGTNDSNLSTGTSNCPKLVTNKSGTVYAGGPKTFNIKPKCNKLEIKVAKTGGKAETQVNVYINNQFSHQYKIEFDNGNYTRTKTKTLTGVKNKNIKVVIVNQSVANKFKYTFKATQKN